MANDITRANLEIIRTPDFEYSGFYYPEIVARLRRLMRTYAPEITNEDSREPFIQLERAFALMAHYNNVLLDMLANDIFISTARHPTSVKLLLELIGYKMLPASPAQVEVLGTIVRTYGSSVRLLESNRKFATSRNEDEPEIIFENISALDTTVRTDQIELAYGVAVENTGVCITSSINSNIIEVSSGYQFVTADLNKMVEINNSVLGNNIEDARITELLDETSVGSGIWNRARLYDASFISESGLTFIVRGITANGAPDLAAATGFTPWSSPPDEGDKFYFGHTDIMWDRFDIVMSAPALGPEGIYEFYDDTEITVQPDLVTIDPSPGYIRFSLNSLLGITSAAGAHVRIVHIPTGYEVKVISVFSGGQNYVDVPNYLGQVSPSSDNGDYLVSCKWRPIDITTITTGTGMQKLTTSGYVKYNLPQSVSDRWSKYKLYDIDAGEQRESYFIRYRIVNNVGNAAGPDITSMGFESGSMYILFSATQGKTVQDNPLGSSSGGGSQEFTLTQTPYIYNSDVIYVDEGGGLIEWTRVDSFLSSYSYDRHYRVDVQTDGSAIIIFGDGVNGRIPPIGTNNIVAVYRVGANEDGNIASGALNVNRDGVGVFKQIINPRAGAFWVEADWDSVESLEKVKKLGPYTLRTMHRACTPRDCEILVMNYRNLNGTKLVSRARAYEEAYGPKTIELVVAGQGGVSLDSSAKTELENYFNGDNESFYGVLILNHELTITNYTPKQIGINMEVTASSIITEAMVLQALSYLISPTAVESDGVTHVWNFGQEVPLSRIIAEIFRISPGNIFKVDITSPTSDININSNELPIFDPINTNVVIIPPSI